MKLQAIVCTSEASTDERDSRDGLPNILASGDAHQQVEFGKFCLFII
jgi:hypothetical protein